MSPPASPPPRDASQPLRLGVSACLLGEEVRYNGGHKRDRFLLATFGDHAEWYPLCPEVGIGLGVPRETLRLVGRTAAPRLVAPASGSDHTEAMDSWSADRREEIAAWDLDGFVLKKGSPSCGLFRVRVYPEGQEMPSYDGRGLFAARLVKAFPLLPVEEEGRLHDAGLRENFIDRLFSYRRWRDFLASDPSPAGLIAFHTEHKLAVLAHSPDHYRRLGRLVADAGTTPWDELIDAYGSGLSEALGVLSSRGRHHNVLLHALGFIKERLDGEDKSELIGLFDDYRRELVPLIVPLTLLRHHLRRLDAPDWLRRQVYLRPYPKELMLRNHV